jgi:adenylate cyclase
VISTSALELLNKVTVLAEFKRTYGDVWVDLSQVEEDDGHQFVELLLDTEPNLLDEGFRNTLFEHTGGHPLFTIELLRALQERGDLVKDQEGNWFTTPELDWETLPARVEGIIGERIGRLDDDLHEILSTASVEGEEFTLQVIAHLLGGDERRLLGSLNRELDKKHRLIKEKSIQWADDKRLHTYRFRHNLFLQYLYGELGEIEREWMHGEIASTLEDLYGDDAYLIAPQLAFHFKQANNITKALQYLILAGRQARDRYANQEAIDYYAKALEFVQKDDLETTYNILMEREAVHALIGNRQERATDLDSLESLVEDYGDVEKRADVAHRRAKYAESSGDYPEAIWAAKQSTDLAWEAGNKELVASAQTEWGRALAFTGSLDEARLHLIKALDLAEKAQPATKPQTTWLKIKVGSLNNLAYISNIQGDHRGSRAYLEQALRINRQISDRRGEGITLQNLGVVSYDQCDFVNAEKYWEKALKIFKEIGDRQHEAMVMTSLGNISSDLFGDYTEAKLRYGRALVIAKEVGDRLNEAMALANIGIVAINQQDFTKAKNYLQDALAIYIEIDLKPEMGGIYLLLGDTFTGLHQLDEAVEAYTKTIHYAVELDQFDRNFEAQAGLAKIAQDKGKLEQALTMVDAILSHMADDQIQGHLESEATMRIYLTCYQILQVCQDSRAEGVLETAHTILQNQASRIQNKVVQQMFLENIPWHREIVENYG